MYQRILVAVDGSATSDMGLAEAIKLARMTKGRLRLLHVIDELSLSQGLNVYGSGPTDWLGALRKAGADQLAQGKAAAGAAGVQAEAILHESFSGSLAETVAAQASSWPADVIVVGTHGRRGIGRLVLGSDAEKILRLAPAPVLLVRSPQAAAARAFGQAVKEALPAAALPLA